jgi:hypothetical protein
VRRPIVERTKITRIKAFRRPQESYTDMQGEPLTLFMCNRDLLSLSQAMRAMTAIIF